MQRYVESGQPHILNRTREVVALHKDRQMFPISLCVARLSGAGMDTLFIGVMRHSAVAGSLDNQIVKVRHAASAPSHNCAFCLCVIVVCVGVMFVRTSHRVETDHSMLNCVQFWMTSTGIILCADSSMVDALGIPAGDLVGRSFSNLCTDVEGVTRCGPAGRSTPCSCSDCTCLAEPVITSSSCPELQLPLGYSNCYKAGQPVGHRVWNMLQVHRHRGSAT